MDRTRYIGGSDIAAVVGLDPWRSPLDVYLEKVGEGRDVVVTEPMKWGTRLEPLILKGYVETTGRKLRRKLRLLVDRQHNFIAGHVDAITTQSPRRVVEAKAARSEWNTPPDNYIAQVQWYLRITGLEVADIVALFGALQLRVYEIQADAEAQSELVEAAVEFWKRHVLERIPPAPRSEADVRKLWSAKTGKQVVASVEIEQAWQRLVDVAAEQARLEAEEKALRDQIAVVMQDATELIRPDGKVLLTWAEHERSTTDWKAVVQRIADRIPPEEMAQAVQESTTTTRIRQMRIRKGDSANGK
jgi:putative phage-type endonuclease